MNKYLLTVNTPIYHSKSDGHNKFIQDKTKCVIIPGMPCAILGLLVCPSSLLAFERIMKPTDL